MKMTKSQMRVAIANDAIFQIKSEKIVVHPAKYLSIISGDGFRVEKDFFKHVKCQVCQIGQAIVCGINLFNNTSISDISTDETEAIKLVQKWFPKKMAVMMEGAFMPTLRGWLTQDYARLTDEEKKSVRKFCRKYRNDEARSLAIWQNIIRNKGNFIP